MKLKTSLFILIATSALVGSASALEFDIVGSTSSRTAVYNQVIANLTTVTGVAIPSGTNTVGSNQAIIRGTIGATPVFIRFNFTGSAAGVNQVANRATVTVPFYKTSVVTGGTVAAPQNVAFSGLNIVNSAAEIGYSDVFQSTTAFKTPVLTTNDVVAIIPFQFFRHSDSNSSLTNVTDQLASAIYGTSGYVPLSMGTGNMADLAKNIYSIGRDEFSGARITAFAEVSTSQIWASQYQPTTSATNGTGSVTALGGTTLSGFTSGSFVANVLNSTFGDGTPANTETIIGYLGASDWPAQVAGNAVSLNFNGVPYSVANLANGSYTFWGYLHQFNNGFAGFSVGDAAIANTFYNDLRDDLTLNPGSGLVANSVMQVTRFGGDTLIFPITE